MAQPLALGDVEAHSRLDRVPLDVGRGAVRGTQPQEDVDVRLRAVLQMGDASRGPISTSSLRRSTAGKRRAARALQASWGRARVNGTLGRAGREPRPEAPASVPSPFCPPHYRIARVREGRSGATLHHLQPKRAGARTKPSRPGQIVSGVPASGVGVGAQEAPRHAEFLGRPLLQSLSKKNIRRPSGHLPVVQHSTALGPRCEAAPDRLSNSGEFSVL